LSNRVSNFSKRRFGPIWLKKDDADRPEKIVATSYIAISRRFGSREIDHNLAIDDTIDNDGKAFLRLTPGKKDRR